MVEQVGGGRMPQSVRPSLSGRGFGQLVRDQ